MECVIMSVLYSTSVTQVCSQYDISKVTLLREFCLKTGMDEWIDEWTHGWIDGLLNGFIFSLGIQILLKDYKYSSLTPFHEDDITSLVPVVKHTDFRVCVVY